MSSSTATPFTKTADTELATFGAGCFWGVEKSFRRKFVNHGVLDVQVGYAGGEKQDVTYREVCSGATGHAEVIQLKFDPKIITLEKLIDFFYRSHDASTKNYQGADHGTQYRSVIFYHDLDQKKVIETATAAANVYYNGKISTTIEELKNYVAGELYHQDYLTVNQGGYECATHFERSWEKINEKFH